MDDASQIALLMATATDTGMRKRLEQINKAQEQHDKSHEAAVDALAKNQAALAQIHKERAEHDTAKADLEAREQKLRSDTAGLASAQATHEDEKSRFHVIREQIERSHAERDAHLKQRETNNQLTENLLDRRSRDLDQREDAVAAQERKHANLAKHVAALQDAMALP